MAAIDARAVGPGWRFSIVRWSAVFAGVAVGLAFMALFTALWLALANGGGWVADTFNWWIGGTAIAATFVGGLLAAWLAGARGVLAGFMNSLTVWAILLIAALAIGLPGLFGAYAVSTTATAPSATASATVVHFSGGVLWTWFWSSLIGLGAATLGGVIGGATPQPLSASGEEVVAGEATTPSIAGRRVSRAG
jgi:hypothetical protein